MGVSIDAQVWDVYRGVCSREKLRLDELIEEFLRLVLRIGSALAVLNKIWGVSETMSEGFGVCPGRASTGAAKEIALC
jgi:hypothetical protein